MYVLMVVPSDFPNGDAGAVRDMAFAGIYQSLGYKVILVGQGKRKSEGVENGVTYYSLYQEKKGLLDHAAQYILYKRKLAAQIKEITHNAGVPDLIHVNDVFAGAFNWLIDYASKADIPIVHDSTEWYSECQFKHGKWDKAYFMKNRLNTALVRNPVKVIAISSYLERHFRSRGLQAIRVPVIMDVQNTEVSSDSADDTVRFIYAGSPAAKDHLKEIAEAVERLPISSRERLVFNIFGIGEDAFKEKTGICEIPECMHVWGRVPREQIVSTMKETDFSILLRPAEERYTKAGFPTKAVEAMSHGVAMVCNLTSDLGMYLKDGQNAVVVRECSADAFYDAVIRILGMSKEQIRTMKFGARIEAERSFDYRIYEDSIKNFIGK